jgi:agmatinase
MSLNNFSGLEGEFSDYNKSKAVILPVPYEGTVTYGKGAAKGPSAIIEASKNMEKYDIELDKHTYKVGIHTLKPIEASHKDPQSIVNEVHKASKKIVADNKFVVMLGGEHSITTGLVKAYKEKFNDLSVLQIDAHSDLRDNYKGTKYNHGCVMSRVREICPITQVGIRSQEINEEKIDKKRIFFAKDIHNNDQWMDKAISQLSSNVYITIDLDGLDPSIMPSTGTPEPGGLLWYQTIRFLKKLAKQKNIVGFDVVELAPIKELHAPDFLAAKLIYKLIGYKFF